MRPEETHMYRDIIFLKRTCEVPSEKKKNTRARAHKSVYTLYGERRVVIIIRKSEYSILNTCWQLSLLINVSARRMIIIIIIFNWVLHTLFIFPHVTAFACIPTHIETNAPQHKHIILCVHVNVLYYYTYIYLYVFKYTIQVLYYYTPPARSVIPLSGPDLSSGLPSKNGNLSRRNVPKTRVVRGPVWRMRGEDLCQQDSRVTEVVAMCVRTYMCVCLSVHMCVCVCACVFRCVCERVYNTLIQLLQVCTAAVAFRAL